MLLLAPFASKLVNYSRHSEYVWQSTNRCHHREVSLILEYFRMFKDSLCRKWSVKMWTTNLYKIFFKNVLLNMNGRFSKICSVHTYVMTRKDYFDWICRLEFTFKGILIFFSKLEIFNRAFVSAAHLGCVQANFWLCVCFAYDLRMFCEASVYRP